MKVIGINGSPRRGWNSDMLLDKALEGAMVKGAEVMKYDLFGMKYRGCISCFRCKKLGGDSYMKCALQDDLTPLLEEINDADGVIISLPIYYGDVPGAVRNLYERLFFPPNNYSGQMKKNEKTKIALIYTMGAPDPAFNGNVIDKDKKTFEMFFNSVDTLNVTDTYQFSDYSKYASSVFSEQAKKKRREEVFPEDLKKAFEMGGKLVD